MGDKKLFLSVILITTVMLFVGGCGKQAEPVSAGPVSAEPTETVKEVDTEESLEPTSSLPAEPEESMEIPEVDDNSEKEVEGNPGKEVEENLAKEVDATEEESGQDLAQDLGYKIISLDDTVMYATANCNIRSGAGTQYEKVGSLSYAQEVTINGKVEAGGDKLWYVIKTEDGSTQMVSGSMLSETKPAAQTSSVNGSGSSSSSGGSPGDMGNSGTASTGTGASNTGSSNTNGTASNENTSNGTVSNDIASNENAPAGTAPAQPAPGQPSSTSEPVHEHSWKEHTATKQVWVPNIVVVDDYEEQTVEVNLYICNCGFETVDPTDITNHGINHILACENDHYTIRVRTETQQVKVGSHEEDHGHYEDSTYVDYYYCDCGATKN